MLTWISLFVRIIGIVLTVWQSDQIRTVYANQNLYASSPGGLFGTISPMVLVIIFAVLLILHPQKGLSGIFKWIVRRILTALAEWMDNDSEFALTVKRFLASTDKAKLLPEPPEPVK